MRLRPDAWRCPTAVGDAGGAEVLRVPQWPSGTASSPGLCRTRQVDGTSRVRPSCAGQFLHRGPHSPPGRERGQHPRGKERARPGVQTGGRRDPGDVRLPGRAGHRQRPPAPGGAAGQGRPGDPGEHYSRGRPGVRREDGGPDVDQPGGETDRQRPVRARRVCGAASRRADLPARRRAGGLPGGVPTGPGAEHRRDGAGRSSSRHPTGGASPPWSTPRPSARRRARPSPSSSPYRT